MRAKFKSFREFKSLLGYGLLALMITVLGTGIWNTLPADAQTGVLDHVTVSPDSTTLLPGAAQQFTAQAFDAANNPITGIGFVWNVAAGGGSINQSGLFTAGSTAGTFAYTVQATAVQGSILKSGAASVTVTATVPIPSPGDLSAKKPVLLVAYSIREIGFDNFMGAQWSVKENSQISQVTVIPGKVKAISATSLSLLPNGKTETQVFSLTSGSSILAGNKGTKGLKVDDKAVVVTVNGTARLVVPVPIRGVSDLPKELKKGDDDGPNGKGKGLLKQMLGKVRKGAQRGDDDKDD